MLPRTRRGQREGRSARAREGAAHARPREGPQQRPARVRVVERACGSWPAKLAKWVTRPTLPLWQRLSAQTLDRAQSGRTALAVVCVVRCFLVLFVLFVLCIGPHHTTN